MAHKKKIPRDKPERSNQHQHSGTSNEVMDQQRNGIRKKIKRKKQETGHQYTYIVYAVTTFLVAVMAIAVYFWLISVRKNIVRTPLNVPRVVAPNATFSELDPARFWGSYRSGLYFGLKTRTPHSPVFGLMWLNQFGSDTSPPSIRHWCDQGDGLLMYSWTAHDGVNFGRHEVVDHEYGLSMDFVKRPGGSHGGDWSVRIHVKQRPKFEKLKMSLFFYMALDVESEGQIMADVTNDHVNAIRGNTPELGKFALIFPKASKLASSTISNYLIGYAPGLDKLKDEVMHSFKMYSTDSKSIDGGKYIGLGGTLLPEGIPVAGANFIVSQLTVDVPFDIEIAFESGSVTSRPARLIGDVFESEFAMHMAQFDQHFDEVFALAGKGYDKEMLNFAKATFSNLIGGIGYFFGSSVVKSRFTPEPTNYWNAGLYTAVPSRSFFPRGFLWDEGFHNILISRWNIELSMDIIGHWLDLMNIEGWIPREQILGSEARSKVPDEFVVQNNENANPPTLFLPLRSIVARIVNDPKDVRGRVYLRSIYPRLQAWYNWYDQSQAGAINSTYRWRGRNETTVRELNPKTLTSGLDDYPRASHPSDNERHIDLRCWMALASGVMADIASVINESAIEYKATHLRLTDNRLLDEQHWSERKQVYSDFGLHTDNVVLERPANPIKTLQPGQRPPPQQPPREKERVVKTEPKLQYVDSAFGYVSLFPFLLRIVDADSPKLEKILVDLKNEKLLWTPYGLRSLAKSSPLYNKPNTEHDPPYWRGSIWININYLALSALHHYMIESGPYQQTAGAIYAELRKNIVDNMYSQYRLTGYVWEQYDDMTGKGKGSHPFTGWSALVVAIMSEYYL